MLIIGLIVTFSLILILVTRKVPIGMAVLLEESYWLYLQVYGLPKSSKLSF